MAGRRPCPTKLTDVNVTLGMSKNDLAQVKLWGELNYRILGLSSCNFVYVGLDFNATFLMSCHTI